MKVLHATDTGTELALIEGDTFEVRLPENASTGYQWSVAGLPDAVTLIDDVVAGPAPILPGAQALHSFRFIVRGPPSGKVALELRRSWEHAATPEAGFEVRVTAVASGGSAIEDCSDERGVEDLDDPV